MELQRIKPIPRLIALSVSLAACQSILTAAQASTLRPATVVVDTRAGLQTFDGWGTSLAWWANEIGGWPSAKRAYIMDLLYGNNANSLMFNIARYNLGADDNNTQNECASQMRAGGNVQSLLLANGRYDFTRDSRQRLILHEAKARGANLFEAFINSAPSHMLEDPCTAGGPWNKPEDKNVTDLNIKSNLKYSQHTAYANYAGQVLKYFKTNERIVFNTFDPFNEPTNGYWYKAANDPGWKQEGMNINVSDQNNVLKEVAKSFSREGLSTQISASDNTNIDVTSEEFKRYEAHVRNNVISQINTHAYKGTLRSKLRNIAHDNKKRLWMSEYGTGGFDGASVGNPEHQMATAFTIAGTILKDVNEMQVNAWVIWQAVEHYDGDINQANTWGLIKANFYTQNSRILKAYYAVGQFSRYIRPGARIYPTSATNALAALNTDGSLAIVIVNSSDDNRMTKIDLSGFSAGMRAAKAYRTSTTEDLKALSGISISQNQIVVELPRKSITTFIVPSVRVNIPSVDLAEGQYKIINRNSGKVLEVLSESLADGAAIAQYADNDHEHQRWRIKKTNERGYYKIVNIKSGKALDMQRGGSANVVQWKESDEDAQKWRLIASSVNSGYFQLANKRMGNMLDVYNESQDDAGPVIVYPNNSQANQQWFFVRTGN